MFLLHNLWGALLVGRGQNIFTLLGSEELEALCYVVGSDELACVRTTLFSDNSSPKQKSTEKQVILFTKIFFKIKVSGY